MPYNNHNSLYTLQTILKLPYAFKNNNSKISNYFTINSFILFHFPTSKNLKVIGNQLVTANIIKIE